MTAWPFALRLAITLVAGYLIGSLNGAIILVHTLSGRDIRTLGSGTPGTANVGRTHGPGWGAIVFFFDGLKVLVPMLLARRLFYPGGTAAETFALAAMGIVTVLGHIKPIWYGFRGGGGVATTIFVYLFFIPVETFVCLLAAAGLALLLIPPTRFRFGRWTPMFAAILAPVAAALTSRYLDLPLATGLRIGGHPWHHVVAVCAVTVFTVLMNVPLLAREIRETRATRG